MADTRELEFVPCPLCKSDEKECSFDFSPYMVQKCLSCGFYYLSPRLTEETMLKIYSDDYYFQGGESGYSDVNYPDQELSFKITFKRLMKNLKNRGLTGGSLLELGCAFGYLLEMAEGHFSSRVGTDFSPLAVEKARERADRVYQGGIEMIPDGEKFDCIITTHVIEHVYEPIKFVRELNDYLKPGGRMVIAAPDVGGVWRYLMGRRWPLFKPPEHINFFDKRSLSRVLCEAGLERIGTLPYPHAFPITLVFKKLGITLPASLGRYNLMIPGTTLAMYGFKKE